MHSTKRKSLTAAGWRIGDAADFLELSDEERQLLEARVQIALAIRQQRQSVGMSQKQLSAKLKTSQPRVAKIESAAADVSLDQLVRAFMAADGTLEVTSTASVSAKGVRKPSARAKIVVSTKSSRPAG